MIKIMKNIKMTFCDVVYLLPHNIYYNVFLSSYLVTYWGGGGMYVCFCFVTNKLFCEFSLFRLSNVLIKKGGSCSFRAPN